MYCVKYVNIYCIHPAAKQNIFQLLGEHNLRIENYPLQLKMFAQTWSFSKMVKHHTMYKLAMDTF
jgi:hypothetical protein